MKDVISILQSRIAKRQKVIAKFMLPKYSETTTERSRFTLIRTAYPPNHPEVICLAKEQKQDKRILAEIVQLRRELKERDVILDRFYRAEEI